MQIPLFWFLVSILLALSWREMSFLLGPRLVRVVGSTNTISTSRGVVSGKDIRGLFPSFSSLLPNKHSSFSTTSNYNKANMSQPFLDAIAGRRSIYPLSNTSPISDAKIQDIIKQTITHIPSSFNSQTTRVVLLVKEEHEKLWEIVKEVLKGVVPAEGWAATEGKLNMFKAAYGTVSYSIYSCFLQPFPKPKIKDQESKTNTKPPAGPLLRLSQGRPKDARRIRNIRRPFPTMGQSIQRNAPIRNLDCPRG